MNLNKLKLYIPNGLSGGSGSGGVSDAQYVRGEGTAVAVGGLPSGYVPSGTVQDVLDLMLYPYRAPAFTDFQMSGQAGILELGAAITAGPKSFLWDSSNADHINAGTLLLRDVTSNRVLASGLNDTGIASGTLTAPVSASVPTGQYSFRIEGTNSNSQTFSRTLTFLWRPRRYAGTIPAGSLSALQGVTTASGLETLRSYNGLSFLFSDLTYAKFGNCTFDCSGAGGAKYVFFLWDTSLSSASFYSGAAPAAFQNVRTLTLTNAFGVTRNYLLYVSTNTFNGAAVPITVI